MLGGSLMAHYFQAHGVEYDMKTVIGDPWSPELILHADAPDMERKRQLAKLINVVKDQKLNSIGKRVGRENPLSFSWYDTQCKGKKTSPRVRTVQRNTETFFRYRADTPTKSNMWTCPKAQSKHLKGRGYSRGFVPINARATNDHIDKTALAYLVNRFTNPIIRGYFEDRGIQVREDLFALSEMVQWVFRSQIRRGDPIDLYIPSLRMRTIFKAWLGSADADILNPAVRLDMINDKIAA